MGPLGQPVRAAVRLQWVHLVVAFPWRACPRLSGQHRNECIRCECHLIEAGIPIDSPLGYTAPYVHAGAMSAGRRPERLSASFGWPRVAQRSGVDGRMRHMGGIGMRALRIASTFCLR